MRSCCFGRSMTMMGRPLNYVEKSKEEEGDCSSYSAVYHTDNAVATKKGQRENIQLSLKVAHLIYFTSSFIFLVGI